ncbi:MAG: glycosyltransferase [Sphingobacteriia bacterium]|nr:glycosyltransferase [Sphingobacteriia bacterium]NCC40088.1 glycosyltransferase [Gammaproteobacteria bacterium]
MMHPRSLQIIASKQLGGAERWFVRFARALAETGAPAELAVRAQGALATLDLGALPLHRLPFLTVWDPWSRSAVKRLIRSVQPDLVQTYMGRATRLTHSAPGRGPVHVARLGGYYALHPYRHAHAWIGNTKGLCDWMVRHGIPAQRVHQIYNFADPARPVAATRIAELRSALGLAADAWVLVTAGRFVPVKGLEHLIAAMARLPARIDGRAPRLILLGEGPLGGALRRQAEALGITERLIWAGWQSDPRPYFQLADLVVFPSLEEETLGNVILESWAWSKPLVTSRFRGAREIVRHGEDAWCVPCADARALADGIRTLLAQPALASTLAQRGAARVQSEFAREPIMTQYLELYRTLTGASA